jgi:hypothetical protein
MQRIPLIPLTACATLLAAMLALFAGPVGAAGGTLIDAGQTFMLGGEQTTELRVRGRNSGSVAVEFLLMANGKERSVATIAPGKTAELRIPAGNIALFRNASDRKAVMKFELTDEVSRLSMRYDRDSSP